MLDQLILRDQLVSIRRNIMMILPINSGISTIVFLMALYYAHGRAGLIWFIAAMTINIIRFVQSWLPDTAPPLPVRQNSFRWLSLTALLSGLVWATLPVLSDYCTNPQTVFYLTVTCGTTAGAVTHGGPYARVPICFVVPPLLSVFACLILLDNFGSACLAATVLLYLVTLLRHAQRAQAEFQETSFLKNQAVQLASSMEETNSASMVVAEQMSYRATHDDLTGLLNRPGFMRQAEAALGETDGPCCLMFIDLDGFKPINEAFGHHAGDRVLVEAARRLALPLGPDCILGRMGGDEFALFYPICSTTRPRAARPGIDRGAGAALFQLRCGPARRLRRVPCRPGGKRHRPALRR
ncbi:GGDEF domain-containing protein [Acidocella sp. MX-AZ03]|uniref:GGDEF domain-containing protein n=1 Tax=Acidocella sp. MX-AZ03 TaxID=2697363 RepID=UPI0022DD1D31|nr:GGDEF domain-containing protein [Acidocella sp. MX-AZ03]WBO60799.1 GGDEF domain-containing protein [Acidocella sp. MX-AZ03]